MVLFICLLDKLTTIIALEISNWFANILPQKLSLFLIFAGKRDREPNKYFSS